ncbi:MAG: hypothetical protein NTZ60_03545 [Campylobacterales bacterium]|nr:hypothetical protein [Campylobacterales bacterium]
MMTVVIDNPNVERFFHNSSDELRNYLVSLVSKNSFESANNTQKKSDIKSLRGVFSDYADSSKQALEESAWTCQYHSIQ